MESKKLSDVAFKGLACAFRQVLRLVLKASFPAVPRRIHAISTWMCGFYFKDVRLSGSACTWCFSLVLPFRVSVFLRFGSNFGGRARGWTPLRHSSLVYANQHMGWRNNI